MEELLLEIKDQKKKICDYVVITGKTEIQLLVEKDEVLKQLLRKEEQLRRKEEQLRREEEQLREERLILLRQQQQPQQGNFI